MGQNKTRKKTRTRRPAPDIHELYEASVQSLDADLDFVRKVYKRKNGRTFHLLREDFCGTAALACRWVERGRENRALGVDLDEPTLAWGRRRRVAMLGKAAERVTLLHADVRDVRAPKVDLTAAFNFSYCVFKTRKRLRSYFESVRKGLLPGGVFVLDLFGGTDAMAEISEKRRIPASKALDGTKVPPFTYIWEQASFNPVDHHILCHIHFKLKDGTKINKAFTYDWRMWMIPELRELLDEAGFASSDVWVEGWDEEEQDGDGIFRKKKRFENQAGWVSYVVGYVD